MANTIKLKKSSVAAKIPLASDLDYGELAINYTDGNLFFKNNSNTVQTIASTQFVSVTGNVTGNYFIGNGSLLTGVVTSVANISNGNSSVSVATDSNVNITINNVSTAVFSEGALAVTGAFATPRTLNSNVTIAGGVNAIIISPVTVDPLANITIPDDSSVTIFTPT